jgi:hypothetical protein
MQGSASAAVWVNWQFASMHVAMSNAPDHHRKSFCLQALLSYCLVLTVAHHAIHFAEAIGLFDPGINNSETFP